LAEVKQSTNHKIERYFFFTTKLISKKLTNEYQALPQHRFWRHLNRIDESSRRRIVHKLLPKLAYVLCDVIIFCTTDELSSDFSVYDRCIAFAQRANSKLKETDRPALVVVHNKFPVSMGNFNSELDVETSSSYFLNTFDPEGELRGLFSACKVVRLPLLSQIHDSGILRSLWDQQIDRLNETIRSLSMERYESRKKFLMGYQLTETSWYKILPKILHDLCAKEEISLARYLLELCQEKMQDKIKLACDLFKCLCESKDQRTVEWYSECASIAVDTLARSWGTTQFEQGLLVDNEAIIQQADVLKPFIEYFNQMRPCTATFVYKKKTYQCLQSQALHDHHRTVVKKTGVRGKMLELLNLRKVTRTWEGNFQCNEMDYQRTRKQLEKQFCTLALAFARQDEETLKEFFTDVFRGPRYTNTIWNAFRESRTDKTLKLWAIELTQYCMKAKHLDRSINLWELATGESGSRPQYFSYLLNVIPVENIKLSENVLGRGAFGTVYSGTFTDASGNEIECAVKVIDENSGVFDLTGFYREVTILSVISHPRLVKFHGGSRTKEKQFYLVQQKLDTDLETWTEQNPSPSVSELLRIIEDIAEGISVIHSFTVVHRDITPANILLKREKDSWRAFLADFGISRAVSIQNMTRYTPNKQFCAPELVNAEVWYCDYTLAVDVYSFGMIMDWLLLHCKPKDKGLETFVEQIQFLVAQCTQNDPQRRPPIVAALLFLEDLNSLLAKNATQEMQII